MQYKDSWTGSKSRLFSVLFVYGYPSDGTRPQMWKVASSPNGSGQHWADFLATLAGKPRVVICDDDNNHQARGPHALVARDSPLHDALNHAFHSSEEVGETLRDKVRELGSPALQRWMKGKCRMMATQLSRRGEIDVYSNDAIEAPIRTVRQGIERRAWCVRNRAQMDLLLEMMRLRLNKVDSVDAYSRLIRDHRLRL